MQNEQYMSLAIALAKSANGQTSPNPLVGAVIVKNGEIVGMGAHLKAGEHHAEVHALRMAGEKAKGAMMYVTLEPCSHFGKTPPCADQVIAAGIAKVFVAAKDPNPLVAGRGIQRLKSAGIEVETGLCQKEADDLNPVFYHFMKHQMPYVTVKTAMSLDGKIATSAGESKWITSEASRLEVHEYRHAHDAILTGVGTVIADNPSLTARLPQGGNNPIRVILDTHLRSPLSSHIFNDHQAPTWIITGSEVQEEKKRPFIERGTDVISLDTAEIDIQSVLMLLGKRGITSLFVEGGAQVNESFLRAECIQQLIIYQAPILIGGAWAPTPFGGEGIQELEKAMKLNVQKVERIGSDIKITAIQGGK